MDESDSNQPAGETPPAPSHSIGPMGQMDESEKIPPPPAGQPVEMAKSVGPMGSMEDIEPSHSEPDKPVVEEINQSGIMAIQVQERHELLPAGILQIDAPEVEPPYCASLQPSDPRSNWLKWPVALLLLGFLFVAVRYQGWELRKQVYLWAHDMHWGDVGNAYSLYGAGAREHGLFNIYSDIQTQKITGDLAKLDYPPLRLTVMYLWAGWGQRVAPGAEVPLWQDAYVLTEPMLRLNMACEGVSAILIFILIRMWTLKNRDPFEPPPRWRWPVIGFLVAEGIAAALFLWNQKVADIPTLVFFYFGAILLAQIIPGMAPAVAGALLFWFNPAIIWNAYAWPQWDVWLFPFLLGAILLCGAQFWFGAGILIAIGALLKGQLLMVAPLFLLWPLFQLRWRSAIQLIGGFALTFAVIVLPWMLPRTSAKVWLGLCVLAIILISPFVFHLRVKKPWPVLLIVAAALSAWPWASAAPWSVRFCVLAIIGLLALAHFIPRRVVPSLYAIGIALFIFLLIPLYGGSSAWYSQSYQYGSEKFMEIGTVVSGAGGTSYTNNLPVLLQRVFSWPNNPQLAMVDVTWLKWVGLGWMGFTEVSVRGLMLTIYAICLVLCAIGTAIHSRRGDPKVLLCMVAPWLCSFVLLTQLNNRYLVWAAGMSALLPAVGVGMSLLGILVSLICWIGMAQLQYTRFPVDPGMAQLLDPLSPHLGWMLTLTAAVFLYVALIPGQRRRALSGRLVGVDHEPLATI